MLTDGYADAFMVGAGIAAARRGRDAALIRGRDSRAHVELGGPAARDRRPPPRS